MSKISLIAVDMDGTLLDETGWLCEESLRVIREVTKQGVAVIVSTGRNFDAIFPETLQKAGVLYAITTNGSAVYELKNRTCLYENGIPVRHIVPVLRNFMNQKLYYEVCIDGSGYTDTNKMRMTSQMRLSSYLKHAMESTERRVKEDLLSYMEETNAVIQKGSIIFECLEDGSRPMWEETRTLLSQFPYLHVVDGGCDNLEFTKEGVSKAAGLQWICRYLSVGMEETMAIGDSENDLEILRMAGVGAAMGNAADEIKKEADFITKSNTEAGVAYAIRTFCLENIG